MQAGEMMVTIMRFLPNGRNDELPATVISKKEAQQLRNLLIPARHFERSIAKREILNINEKKI